ncbi:hypothetical protein PAAG_00870 [Paracoccidioides lutzii Pb01]|uniref:Complex 1 LYR protein domain-containing protein n=1 Tax=Paracoccidioides lutzii (strain ATCC MYA-826 / Pb01) TaxID=502779 RepID=C1GQS5_PARBA|nr:hypothetical protein PAAG_00870 [Paracoccidioides lutzii Pb01]EEH37949.2 hypothetical protein PAAG_00870 [Paracoccidioides lutzii Pb01]
MKLSGLQREVLALYRHALREIRKKPKESQDNFKRFARQEFRKNMNISKMDFSAIEYLLRRGRRQVETYSSAGIRNVLR